jgi:acetylornithine deacetylase/succinyl-diaminopimelate desuccinylase-like protein
MCRKVRAFMPGVIEDLKKLVAVPSVAFPGYPPEPVHQMAEMTVDLLRRYGLKDTRLLGVPGGYPAVYGELPPPPGAPVVLLYSHYDVQPARKEDGWEERPVDAGNKRRAPLRALPADNKSGILSMVGIIKALGGSPPVGIKVVIEGEEEAGSHLDAFVEANPDLFRCDLFITIDVGKLVAGEPVMSTTLRGDVSCTVTVRTLNHAVHSGVFGGPAPDALVVLIRMLATLHDENGDVAVPGLLSYPWTGAEFPEPLYRRLSGLPDGVDTIWTGTISSRVWSKPSLTVIGIDAPAIRDASNILIPQASARISMRIAPGADPQ